MGKSKEIPKILSALLVIHTLLMTGCGKLPTLQDQLNKTATAESANQSNLRLLDYNLPKEEAPTNWQINNLNEPNENEIKAEVNQMQENAKFRIGDEFREEDLAQIRDSLIQIRSRNIKNEDTKLINWDSADCTAFAIYKDDSITIFSSVQHCIPGTNEFTLDITPSRGKTIRLKKPLLYIDDSKKLSYIVVLNSELLGVLIKPLDLPDETFNIANIQKIVSLSFPGTLIKADGPQLWGTEFSLMPRTNGVYARTDKDIVLFGGRISKGSSGGPQVVKTAKGLVAFALSENVLVVDGDGRYVAATYIFKKDLNAILNKLNKVNDLKQQ